jgi:protoporphyrinogen oxidase
MVPDASKTSLGLEYFASSDESFWKLPDSELIAWALSDLEKVGLGKASDFGDAFVIRQPYAYPIYEHGYKDKLATIRKWLATVPNLVPMGRAGLFRYCNSDLALLLGYYAARNFLGTGSQDIWNVE